MYDLDELDLNWLTAVNQKRKFRALAGINGLSEETLREALIALETKCQQGMARAITTQENLGIEYDEQTVCDVCQDHESEESNDMIFCDSCNVCVHQACYGVTSVPRGSWLCKVCSSGVVSPDCALCFNKGGALKRVRPGNHQWAHISCALWIPEVRLGNVDRMEPITNIEAVPLSRWNLTCCLCKKKQGACVQCCHPSCVIAYHVTCGFSGGLIMKSKLDMINNTVIHESFCPKHTAVRRSPHSSPRKHGSSRQPSQLIQLQETFHEYADSEHLTKTLKTPPKLAALIYNYWKLKRRSQHNRTLLSDLPIETALESVKEMSGTAARSALRADEDYMKIVHIRQNLEKARNLIYMVQRRERLKKQLLYNTSHSWELEAKALDSPAIQLSIRGPTTAPPPDETSNGPTCSSSSQKNSKPKLRNGFDSTPPGKVMVVTGPHLRHRPYTLHRLASTEPS
ncbi:E3 ubiquitin-protein ligase Jade-2-like isoform X2 [Halichondria panicea]